MSRSKLAPVVPEGELSKENFRGVDFLKLGSEFNSPFAWFLQINNRIPNIISFGQGDYDDLYTKILRDYAINEKNITIREEYLSGGRGASVEAWSIFLTVDIMFSFSRENGLSFLYSHKLGEESVSKWMHYLKNLTGYVNETEENNISGKDKLMAAKRIFLLQLRGGTELVLKPFDIPKPELDVKLHYNNDFGPVHKNIFKRLQTNGDSGLILLHGEPGTGKTTYIRYLSFLLKKPVIYLTPNLARKLDSVDFVSFMLEHPDSILIIEDAESIISSEAGRTGSIAGLLNITDGLLGDCLNIQIICTFNTDLFRIEKALLRKGRLIELYEFRKLKVDKVHKLLEKLGKEKVIENDMTLASVFNIDDPLFNYGEKGRIGFKIR